MNEIVGFTGTRKGITPKQIEILNNVVSNMSIKETHDGGCDGADDQFRDVAKHFKNHVHPSIYQRYKKYPECVVYDVKDPIVRNHIIVDSSTVMIATPGTQEEVIYSGTWATIRYSKKKSKPLLIIYPNGKTEQFNMIRQNRLC